MRRLLTTFVITIMLVAPQAFACGGLFCDSSAPVNQIGERILFAKTDSGFEMHVRINYAGPPNEFGWLLPVPQGVEYAVGSDTLFDQLDSDYQPTFFLRTEFVGDCGGFGGAGGSGGGGGVGGAGGSGGTGGGIDVLAREAVGPYDLAVLLPQRVEDLREWLEENEYQIPADTDAKLSGYIQMNAAFVALKLLPGVESGEVQPLRMWFDGDIPSIPIIPTSVAATPDMGLIVHLLGPSRAVPSNYRHVQINEAALDWRNLGANYMDVVSQAIDEAGGQAFTTDYAGDVRSRSPLTVITPEQLEMFTSQETGLGGLGQQVQSDRDLQRLFRPHVTVPDAIPKDDFLSCPACFRAQLLSGDITVDKEAIVEAIETQLNPSRVAINGLFETNAYMTRLYGTMSPNEMTLDPVFAFNADLEDIPSQRTATQYLRCDGGADTIQTESGLTFGTNATRIVRQAGETVRGMDVPGARVIEQHLAAGQPELIEDKTAQIMQNDSPGGGGQGGFGGSGGAAGTGGASGGSASGGDSGDGCACDASNGSSAHLVLLLLLYLPVFRRRQGSSLRS